MTNPVYMLGKLQPKTIIPDGAGMGGVVFDKMIIAGALAGLKKPAQNAALCIWCMDHGLTIDLAEDLLLETLKNIPPELTGIKNTTARNFCQLAVAEQKSPRYKLDKKTREMEIRQLTNAQLADHAGIKKQSITFKHAFFYNTAISILQGWLSDAYAHVKANLGEMN